MLKNKIAVITGNPYGIGRVSAALFAREGAEVVCIDDSRDGWTRNEAPHFIADVSDRKAIAAIAAECAAVYGILCKRVFCLMRQHAIFELNREAVQGSFPVMNGHGPFPANVV